MAKIIEKGTNYAYTIERIKEITFKKLRSVAIDFTKRLPLDLNDELYGSIQRGICQLESEPELNMYLHALGPMHEAKLQFAYEQLPKDFTDKPTIDIIDYGCGQAIGTMCYADFLRENGITQKVRKVTLIEPSEMALKRAALHTSIFFPNTEIVTINKGFDDLVEDDFCISTEIPTLHIFSNVLDLAHDCFNLKSFAYLLRECIFHINQFVCIEPYFGHDNIDEYPYLFFKFLNIDNDEFDYCKTFSKGNFIQGHDWTCHVVIGYKYVHCGEVCNTTLIEERGDDGVSEEISALRAEEENRFCDAYRFYEISAIKGNKDVYFKLGEYNFYGKGIEINETEAVKWYRKAVSSINCERALFRLGECYEYGVGVVKNKFEAVKYYQRSAEYGYTEAEVALGKCYLNGEGIEKDFEEAVRFFRLANCCNADAQYYLGLCYEEGKGVKSIPAEAVKWYLKSAEQGYANAQCNLGNCYSYGRGVTQSYTEAVKWYRKAAEQGLAEAQSALGSCYANGRGVDKDYLEAIKWYRKAAEQGFVKAQYNLGVCYDKGYGVDKNVAEAVKWYRKAAEQGFASAQNNLGVCYDEGDGVTQSHTEAVKWYRKAAEQGYADAQFNLGVCYDEGDGVTQSHTEAMKWYRKAAEQGYADAQFNLGVCYTKGEGVTQSHTEAVKWYRKAAEQGLASAQYNLGVCYKKGHGVDKNIAESVKWFNKAAAQGVV